MPMQVNITTQVNSKQIRRFEYNGREHIALPSYTLPAGVVMNGGLYTAEEIDANYQGLEGGQSLAPFSCSGGMASALMFRKVSRGMVLSLK